MSDFPYDHETDVQAALELYHAFQVDPEGTYQAIGYQLAEQGYDPDDGYAADVQAILAAHPGLDEAALHQAVVDHDGDFEKAVPAALERSSRGMEALDSAIERAVHRD
jgi:hypothetical protein